VDKLYVFPISYAASIKTITVLLNTATTNGRFDVGIYPIKNDGSEFSNTTYGWMF
jgi:hypothetical protein